MGRDLYDLYKAVAMSNIHVEDVLFCYRKYMNFVVETPPTRKEFMMNMELKMQDDEFLGDTKTLLRQGEDYNPYEAFEIIKSKLLNHL